MIERLGWTVVGALFVIAIASCAASLGQEATEHSAQIVKKGGQILLRSRAALIGAAPTRKVIVGDSVDTKELAVSGLFSVRMINMWIAAQPKTNCEDAFKDIDFAALSSRLTSLAFPPPILKKIVFEVIYVAPGPRYEYEDVRPVDESLVLRFPFAAPGLSSDCRQWWLDTLGILVHEYVHVYIALTGLDVPNMASEEVVAYSLERCVLLAIAKPNELGLTTFESNGQHVPIDVLYPRFVNVDFVWANPDRHTNPVPSFGPTGRGRVLADLQLFELFDRSVQNALTPEQQNGLEHYCRTLISEPIDFLKESYFEHANTGDQDLKPLPLIETYDPSDSEE